MLARSAGFSLDRRVPGYRSDSGKERLDPVGKTVRLLCYGLSGAFASEAQDTSLIEPARASLFTAVRSAKLWMWLPQTPESLAQAALTLRPGQRSGLLPDLSLCLRQIQNGGLPQVLRPASKSTCDVEDGASSTSPSAPVCVTCRLNSCIGRRVQRAGFICVRLLSSIILSCLTERSASVLAGSVAASSRTALRQPLPCEARFRDGAAAMAIETSERGSNASTVFTGTRSLRW